MNSGITAVPGTWNIALEGVLLGFLVRIKLTWVYFNIFYKHNKDFISAFMDYMDFYVHIDGM